MDFDGMYQRLNRSSPSLSALNKPISLQAPIDCSFEPATALHHGSASATLGSPNETMEEIDTSTRPRLTHEQVTQLEEEFSKVPKPNTDFKKNLADRIGLTLARVNVSGMAHLLLPHRTDPVQQNWYQNRRAKSKNGLKTNEAQFEVRSDDSLNPWTCLDPSFQDFVNMSYFDIMNPHLLSPDAKDRLGATSYYFGDGANCQYNAKPANLHMQDPVQIALDSADNMGVRSSLDSTIPIGHLKSTAADPADYDFDSYSPDNLAGIAMPEEMPVEQHLQPKYQIATNGVSLGNLSNQTFMSATSSSDGEPSIMTPPEKPSPTSLQPQDLYDRPWSVTGGLTTDFHTFHLQSRKSNPGLYEDACNTGSGRVSPAAPVTQWINCNSPPSVNRESITPSLSNRIDLASRRKRPRPAPLMRPDPVQRSNSYGGPLTSSPRSRKMLLDPSHPVRRVRSGVDIIHGRVQKPSSTTAQLSPRVFENRFQATVFNNRSPSRCNSTVYQEAPLTPLSAAHTGEHPTQFSVCNSENGIPQQGMPTSYENSLDFNSPPITPYCHDYVPIPYGQRAFSSHASTTHEPPQSAPPQKTNFFFNDSPPMSNTNHPHLSWQLPAEVPSNSFQSQTPVVPAQPQYNGMTGQFEQSQVPLVYRLSDFQHPPQLPIPSHGPPQYVLQGSSEHLYAQYPLQHYQPSAVGPFQHTLFEPQMVPQPLEIKVELGPSPQGTPQPRKQYTFSNSTPDDYCPPKDEAQR